MLGERTVAAVDGICALLGLGGLAVLHSSLTDYLLLSILTGATMGICASATRTLSVEAVPVSETVVAAGVNELMLSLGGVVGAAVFSATLSAHTGSAGAVAIGGYTEGWAVCGAVGALAALDAIGLRPTASRTEAPLDSLASESF